MLSGALHTGLEQNVTLSLKENTAEKTFYISLANHSITPQVDYRI